MTVPSGVRLGIDWGKARIGVAACDAAGVLAYPVETIAPASDRRVVTERLRAILAEYEPVAAYVGQPRHLRGAEGEAAEMARAGAAFMAGLFPELDVRLVDERLTTVTASRQLHEAGRSTRAQRSVIDQAAAVAILNLALDAERVANARVGERIDGRKTR